MLFFFVGHTTFKQLLFDIAGTVALGPACEPHLVLKKCVEMNQGNAVCQPLLDTLYPITWSKSKYKVGAVMCETQWLDGSPQDACPRYQ